MVKINPLGQFRSSIKDVHVYGGGISGLLQAYFLKKKGYRVSLFEKSQRLGGKIQTSETPFGIVEAAANAVIASEPVLKLVRELNLNIINQNPGLSRKLVRKSPINGTAPLCSMPYLSPLELGRFFLFLFSSCPGQSGEMLTVEEFFKPLLGANVCEEILSPALGGIYALGAKELHFQSLFSGAMAANYFNFFRELKKSKKGRSISFKGGMQELINALAKNLENEIHTQSSPPLDPKVNICLCTSASQAAELLSNSSAFMQANVSLINNLKKIKYITLSTATYFFSSPIPKLKNSFGILFSSISTFKHLGILNNSAIFKGRVINDEKIFSYTFISKSEKRESSDGHEDVIKDLSLLNYQFDANFLGKESTFYQEGIPAYDKNRFQLISEMSKQVPTGLVLFGNYTNGISIRDLITKAESFAELLDATAL